MDTDKLLYDQFLAGDHKALEQLIDIHKHGLTLFLYSYLNNMTEAEDMMIDVFAQLVVSSGQFKGKSSLKTYIFAIARNEALRYLKKHKHHLNIDDMADGLAIETDLMDTHIRNKEQNLQLYTAMAKLPSRYREILVLLYFEDCSYKEAAQIMSKNEKQITNLAYRAKKALKDLLEKENFTYDGE